jgi:hypothetical protein
MTGSPTPRRHKDCAEPASSARSTTMSVFSADDLRAIGRAAAADAWSQGMTVRRPDGSVVQIPLVCEPQILPRATLLSLAARARAILSGAAKLARYLISAGNPRDRQALAGPFRGLELEAMEKLFAARRARRSWRGSTSCCPRQAATRRRSNSTPPSRPCRPTPVSPSTAGSAPRQRDAACHNGPPTPSSPSPAATWKRSAHGGDADSRGRSCGRGKRKVSCGFEVFLRFADGTVKAVLVSCGCGGDSPSHLHMREFVACVPTGCWHPPRSRLSR